MRAEEKDRRQKKEKESQYKPAIKKCYKKEQQEPEHRLSLFSPSAPSGKDHMLKRERTHSRNRNQTKTNL